MEFHQRPLCQDALHRVAVVTACLLREPLRVREDYIPKFLPRHPVVYHWFDVYDLEEQRL